MLQSFHQASENFEILFNKKKYDALAPELKTIVASAVDACSADMSWKAIDRYSKDYIELREKNNVKFFKTPDSILQAQLVAWDKVIAKKSAENPMFAKVLESMRTYAQRAGAWQNDTLVNYKMAYNHFFAKPAAPAKKA
jgi:TRAP-type mannitol/chloroaromatic compound transport system substrate-binding protein